MATPTQAEEVATTTAPLTDILNSRVPALASMVIFSIVQATNRRDFFTKTMVQLMIYVGRTYWRSDKAMILPTVTMPIAPEHYGIDKCHPSEKFMHELDMKKVRHTREEINREVEKLYALVLGQFTDALKALIEAPAEFLTVSDVLNGVIFIRPSNTNMKL